MDLVLCILYTSIHTNKKIKLQCLKPKQNKLYVAIVYNYTRTGYIRQV